ncbi:MAG TPA: DNA polymerase III subunit gamma and tau [Nocardioidaceae bacterium]|nr:DNA polymerase III subunit gamma and tau [Nocardioidaceae bacterium]
MDAPLALYRRYRPETFAEVIGQDHVTDPLRHALAGNRVHHAYLFSGPRGCGKTTSARILARALNCEQGPTPEPCGRCESCRNLARGGPGSIDVIEIDAASHGGVDDARDLRERAFFAPVSSRYKVYIVDEAHMVSPQGFNALLKLVEEPPPHLKFIFATTEPEKVIGTIKSRTHHYPFRLVPPKLLGDYLAEVCQREGVSVEPAVLPLVVRAGAGSVRDTLSVLDQLIGGAGPDGLTYDLATGLLGYTPESLLDEVVDAFSAGDAGSVFAVVDKVIETGQDPRRFGEDLLHRLRDLVIVNAVPDAVTKGIVEAPGDQADRLTSQAARFGAAELARAADVVSQGLTDMRGATAPRLLLELVCARVLLPGADDSAEGVHARLDRIERRMAIGGTITTGRDQATATTGRDQTPHASEPTPLEPTPLESAAPEPPPLESAAAEPGVPEPAPPAAPQPPADEPVSTSQQTGGMSLVDVRRLWPEVLERVKEARRFTWILLSQNSQVSAFDGQTLTVGMVNAGARDRFAGSGSDAILRQALIDVLGLEVRVEAIVDGASPAATPPPARPAERSTPAPPTAASAEPAAADAAHQHTAGESAQSGPGAAAVHTADADPPLRVTASPQVKASAREAIQPTRSGAGRGRGETSVSDDDAHPDDVTVSDSDLGHDELLARELGARVIEEIPHN